MKSIAVRRKTAHRRGVGKRSREVAGVVVVHRSTQIIAVGSGSIVIRLAMADRITPREALAAQAAARGFFPLRLRRQTVAVGGPFNLHVGHIDIARLVNCRLRVVSVIHRRQPLLLAAGVTPLHHLEPRNRLHRMIAGLARSGREIAVAIADGPRPHRVPLRLGHEILRHVKRADIHRASRGIGSTIQRIAHREAAGRDEGEAGGCCDSRNCNGCQGRIYPTGTIAHPHPVTCRRR